MSNSPGLGSVDAYSYNDPDSMTPFEPCMTDDWIARCGDVIAASGALSAGLPIETRTALLPLLAGMNCYYSNLIEGHRTFPGDVDAALHGRKFSKKNEQLVAEAIAHIEVQKKVASIRQSQPDWDPASLAAVLFMHFEFVNLLPEEFQWAQSLSGSRRIQVIGGEFRNCAVHVGEHVPPDHRYLDRFMRRFHESYCRNGSLTPMAIGRCAASHQRFTWIHPFLDGNGRVARLMTDAMIEQIGLGSGGLWRMSRGFARNGATEYRTHLAAADAPRYNDTDGRGALSQRALDTWCDYFLTVALDQIQFMAGLLNLTTLHNRIAAWCKREDVVKKRYGDHVDRLLTQILFRGKIERGEAATLLDLSERYARTVIERLIADGLVSSKPREPLLPAFPLAVTPYWFPSLFPGDVEAEVMGMG